MAANTEHVHLYRDVGKIRSDSNQFDLARHRWQKCDRGNFDIMSCAAWSFALADQRGLVVLVVLVGDVE